MKYDPIKRKLGVVFNSSPGLRKLFYNLLDILLLRSWHIRKELKIWESTISGKQSILDAGSGFGQYDYYIAKRHRDWKITGIDVKKEQIEDCNNFFSKIGFNNTSFKLGDLTKLEYNEEFNMILCVDVMEHIEEDELVLKNFHKALKKGGMLMVSTPSDQGGSDVHHHDHDDYINDGEHSFIDEHVRDGYGITDITDKMKRAGFTKTKVYYQYGKPGKLAWKLSMKYPIVMLNKTYLFFLILPLYYLVTFPFVLLLNNLDVIRDHKSGTGLVALAWK
ncbi:MAG: methyltransferase type 11 [Lentimicrobiaceae bacterium]|nr:methyltransferase type 11 [Lentimicrobiaceae bacterium]MDG2081704.1 class I SAM-dependent methyltransferase [Bacteroidales bacterium]|tara:strand:- start:3939 stop:4769 length:831 start_codon:yes stop_codon:yes gene_type:complete